jgi:hypothetical protein
MFNQRMEGKDFWEVAWVDLDRPTEIRRLPATHAGAP